MEPGLENKLFLSTLSLRRATARRASRQHPAGISIHALLAESDRFFFRALQNKFSISIHALLAESDGSNQSIISQADDFYPRSPCGERRLSYFYIIKITQFLSTLSLRRATDPGKRSILYTPISIHALLAESDSPAI